MQKPKDASHDNFVHVAVTYEETSASRRSLNVATDVRSHHPPRSRSVSGGQSSHTQEHRCSFDSDPLNAFGHLVHKTSERAHGPEEDAFHLILLTLLTGRIERDLVRGNDLAKNVRRSSGGKRRNCVTSKKDHANERGLRA